MTVFNQVFAITVIFFYLAATGSIFLMLMGKLARTTALSASFIAVGLHALLLYHWIDLVAGQNLASLNMLSFVTWLIAFITLLIALRKPAESLLLLIFPVNAISIFLVMLFPQVDIVQTAMDLKQLFHVLLTAFTLSVLCIAGLQALFLAFQEQRLRGKSKQKLLTQLPPLETMETLLFQIISIGFLLLSLVIVTSLYFFYDRITFALIQKILLAFIAWIIFGILLIGRYYFRWRGKKAIYGTLIGVLLLIVIYFGSFFLVRLLH